MLSREFLHRKKPDRLIRLWRECLNSRKAGQVLLVVRIDAGDAVGQHRRDQEEVKDLLAGDLRMVSHETEGLFECRTIGIDLQHVVGTSIFLDLRTSLFG
jgi:hypothetical protein